MDSNEAIKYTNYIFLKDSLGPADIIMVFGTRYEEATLKAYELYNRNLSNKILVSGGINRVTDINEASTMKNHLMKRGVPSDDIIIEDESSNTLQNVINSLRILDTELGINNIHSIIAVTKNYHSRRAIMTLRKHFPARIKIFLATYTINNISKDNWFKTGNGKNKVIGEYGKIQEYLMKGDIEEL